jgi:cell division protein FtsQ
MLLVGVLRGFALEVLAVVRGIGRGVLRVVPGVRLRAGDPTSRAGDPAPRPVRTRRRSTSRRDAPRGPSQQRAAAARRARTQRRIRIVLACALVASIGAAWVFVPASDAFRIRHVEVTGTRAVDDLAVRQRVDSLLAGQTIFTADRSAIERRIEQLPFVRTARVERHLPGGLQLHVTEYRPLALAYGDGKFWLVARDGRVLAAANGDAWRGRIPTVELQGRRVTAGMRLDDEPALKLLSSLRTGSTLQVDVVRTDRYLLEATLVDGVVVRFGRPTQLLLKSMAAERTLQLAERNGEQLRYVDVSVPGKPAWCPESDAACHQPRGPVDPARAGDAQAAPTTPEESGGDEADVSTL